MWRVNAAIEWIDETVLGMFVGLAAVINFCLVILHFLIAATLEEYWSRCGVLKGEFSPLLVWLIWLVSPMLLIVALKFVDGIGFDRFFSLLFVGLVAMIAAYDVGFFMAFIDRGDAPVKSLWDANFVHSGFCELTRAILPSRI